MCCDIYDTTSRYDYDRKVLTFLLSCPVCGLETVVARLDYEPAFSPAGTQPASQAPA
jgi:hypothetical protein